jgi:hypothetical protein
MKSRERTEFRIHIQPLLGVLISRLRSVSEEREFWPH